MKGKFLYTFGILVALLLIVAMAVVQAAYAETLSPIVHQGFAVLGFVAMGVMLNLHSPLGRCKTMKFTAGADITVITTSEAGADPVITPELVAVGDVSGFVLENVANGDEGVLLIETDSQGYDVPQKAEAIPAGAAVYWDPDGNPYGGVAGSGAATATDDATHNFIGYNVGGLTTTTTTYVRVQLALQPPAKAV